MSLQLAYYADDFTGSTDALEFLARAGARTALFIEPPSAEQVARFGPLDAIGVAGFTRSMGPGEMETALRRDFVRLAELQPRHVHYKVCSTFDSSPTIGSIGRAIDVGAEVFGSKFVPLLVAAPALGRYCAFGNLFARLGIGTDGAIHRLDRHPVMRSHPISPTIESDLRIHLGKQTAKRIGLFDILALEMPEKARERRLKALCLEGDEVVLFDTLYPRHLRTVGHLLESSVSDGETLFSVGSSGVEMALGMAWDDMDRLVPRQTFPKPDPVAPLLVVSGSCSSVTAAQIESARTNGFEDVAMRTDCLLDASTRSDETERVTARAADHLRAGRSVVVHTATGPTDPRVEATRAGMQRNFSEGGAPAAGTASLFGTELGQVALRCVERGGLRRLLLAGGDSSSYAARAMGIEAIQMIAPLVPGAPLCRSFAPGSAADGIEMNFKGGQVGAEDYFGMVAQGKSH